MCFFSPANCGLVLCCFLFSGISLPAETESDIALESVLKEAQERSRRDELLAIERDLRAIYASLTEPGIPDLERSRRLAPIAARYENHLKRYPEDAEAFVLYAKFLRDGGDDEGAAEYFEKARKLQPGWAVVWQQLAAIAAERGDGLKAFPLMKRAAELEPGQAVYHLQLGELITAFRDELLKSGIFETRDAADTAMQNAFRAARALAPHSPETAVRYAESFYDVEKPDWRAALEAWNVAQRTFAARATDEDVPAATLRREMLELHRARAYAELGNDDESEKILECITDGRLAYSCARIRKIIVEKRKLSANKE